MNFPNFQTPFTTGGSYTLEFWIKLDRINEFCKIPDNFKKYYFISDPHSIYAEPVSLTTIKEDNQDFNRNNGYKVYYQMLSNPEIKVELKNFSQFNWNHVLIHMNNVSKNFRVVTNFNYYNADYAVDGFDFGFETKAKSKNIIFCSNNQFCNVDKKYLDNIAWGAAFYKDLRLSEGTTWNFFSSQEYIGEK